jgi:hypothetical protein
MCKFVWEGINKRQGELDRLRAENEQLRGLVRQLIAARPGGYDPPYAKHPPSWDWECVYCEGEWEESTTDRHADDCPVVLARAELEGDG